MRLTDRRRDRILIARPRLHSMQRGKNDCQLGNIAYQPNTQCPITSVNKCSVIPFAARKSSKFSFLTSTYFPAKLGLSPADASSPLMMITYVLQRSQQICLQPADPTFKSSALCCSRSLCRLIRSASSASTVVTL